MLSPLAAALEATARTAPRWMYKFQVQSALPGLDNFARRMADWDNTRGQVTLAVPVDADPLETRQNAERMIRNAGFCAYYVWYLWDEVAITCEWTVWEFDESAETCLQSEEYLSLSKPNVWMPDDMPDEAKLHVLERLRQINSSFTS